jgi:hypothetical protein
MERGLTKEQLAGEPFDCTQEGPPCMRAVSPVDY